MVRVIGGWVSWVPSAERGWLKALKDPLWRLHRPPIAWTEAQCLFGQQKPGDGWGPFSFRHQPRQGQLGG